MFIQRTLINLYIGEVVLTGKYKGGLPHTKYEDDLAAASLCVLLCQTITEIERINNPHFPALTRANLNAYIEKIPTGTYEWIGGYHSSNLSDNVELQNIFSEMSKKIHALLPLYDGASLECIQILLFSDY